MLLVLLAAAVVLLAGALRFADEGDLLQRLRKRDPDAARLLYDRMGRLTYGLILRIVRNEGIAEELVQETFLRIWNRLEFFDTAKGALAPWVLAVARNQAIDYLRSAAGRTSRTETVMDGVEEPSAFLDMADEVSQHDKAKQVRGAIGKLEEKQRRVIELAYFEGLSQSEIAAKLNQPLGSVKSWTRSALKILREELREVATA